MIPVKKGLLFGCVLTLCACATVQNKKPPVNQASTDASVKLAEAATSVSHSLLELAQIESSVNPVKSKPLVSESVYNLQNRASVDWSGPVQPLVTNIAKAAHYRVRVLGHAPAIPILINLTEKDQTLATLLRNIDYQAGKKANIKIYPNTKMIELRYAKA